MERIKLSLPALLQHSVEHYPGHTALSFCGQKLDFKAFDELSDRVAAFLAEHGIQKGDRVGLYSANCLQFPIAYFGILKAGAVVVPVNVLLSPEELGYIFNDAGIRALIFNEHFADPAGSVSKIVDSLSFSIGIGEQDISSANWQWSDVCNIQSQAPEPAIEPANDLAAIIYTSGTTGQPKGAMLSHKNLASNAASVKQAIAFQAGDERVLVVLPMFHSFAGTVGMILPLLFGGTMVIVPKFDPQLVAQTIETEQASIFLGVPTMYSYLLRLPDSVTAQLQGLRVCISGGAAMPIAVMEAFESRFGIGILEGDGPTECSPVTCVNPIQGARKIGSVGLPIPEVEMKIMDLEGQEVETGEMGEICVRGPNIMKGYWNQAQATAESFFDDWFRTGDLGHQDEDGYFFITDRLKDMLICNGINVYPRMIEEVLYRLPAIEEAAVIGEPDKLHGEIPVAYVAFKARQSQSSAEVIDFCREYLGKHEVPRKVYVLEQLPKNATGKILKRALRVQGERERGMETEVMVIS